MYYLSYLNGSEDNDEYKGKYHKNDTSDEVNNRVNYEVNAANASW